eukprot:tig00021726_g23268.t1
MHAPDAHDAQEHQPEPQQPPDARRALARAVRNRKLVPLCVDNYLKFSAVLEYCHDLLEGLFNDRQSPTACPFTCELLTGEYTAARIRTAMSKCVLRMASVHRLAYGLGECIIETLELWPGHVAIPPVVKHQITSIAMEIDFDYRGRGIDVSPAKRMPACPPIFMTSCGRLNLAWCPTDCIRCPYSKAMNSLKECDPVEEILELALAVDSHDHDGVLADHERRCPGTRYVLHRIYDELCVLRERWEGCYWLDAAWYWLASALGSHLLKIGKFLAPYRWVHFNTIVYCVKAEQMAEPYAGLCEDLESLLYALKNTEGANRPPSPLYSPMFDRTRLAHPEAGISVAGTRKRRFVDM